MTTAQTTPAEQHLASALDLSNKPDLRLAFLENLLDEIVVMQDANVAQMQATGETWQRIGEATGMTRQGAQQRWGA